MAFVRSHQVARWEAVLDLSGERHTPSELVLKLAEEKGVLNVVLNSEAGRSSWWELVLKLGILHNQYSQDRMSEKGV